MNAKKVIPPRKRVRSTAKRRYRTEAPDMPSTARTHVSMGNLWSESTARKYEKMARVTTPQRS